MGQKFSTAMDSVSDGEQNCLVPTYVDPWSLILTDTVESWNQLAGAYGFPEYPYGCVNRDCDRDSVCLKRARAVLKRSSCNIEIQRYKQNPKLVSYAKHPELKAKVSQGFLLSEVVAAMKEELVLVIFYRWERLQYEAVFILLDLDTYKVLGHFDSPMVNMSIMECKISPDSSCIVVLFYLRHDITAPFSYDLYLFSTETFRVMDIIPCNKEVRPYVTFDPRYRSSRIAIVNYLEDQNCEETKSGLVLYCLKSKSIVAVSHLMLSIIYGGAYFCVNYSKDGSYLILQKISDNMNGAHCYADSYIFNSDNLKLLKHYFANLQAFSTLCGTNYAPLFSYCGSRMCIMNEETKANGERQLQVSIYQLPRPISLQEQCRIIILQNMAEVDNVDMLPLPRRIKEFLEFTPQF